MAIPRKNYLGIDVFQLLFIAGGALGFLMISMLKQNHSKRRSVRDCPSPGNMDSSSSALDAQVA